MLGYFYRFGFVEYATVAEAQAVFDKPENIVIDGRIIYVDYAGRRIDEKPSKYHLKRLNLKLAVFLYHQVTSLQGETVRQLQHCL